jgi:hypothetical protein
MAESRSQNSFGNEKKREVGRTAFPIYHNHAERLEQVRIGAIYFESLITKGSHKTGECFRLSDPIGKEKRVLHKV